MSASARVRPPLPPRLSLPLSLARLTRPPLPPPRRARRRLGSRPRLALDGRQVDRDPRLAVEGQGRADGPVHVRAAQRAELQGRGQARQADVRGPSQPWSRPFLPGSSLGQADAMDSGEWTGPRALWRAALGIHGHAALAGRAQCVPRLSRLSLSLTPLTPHLHSQARTPSGTHPRPPPSCTTSKNRAASSRTARSRRAWPPTRAASGSSRARVAARRCWMAAQARTPSLLLRQRRAGSARTAASSCTTQARPLLWSAERRRGSRRRNAGALSRTRTLSSRSEQAC